jgi:hypothetical protein
MSAMVGSTTPLIKSENIRAAEGLQSSNSQGRAQ